MRKPLSALAVACALCSFVGAAALAGPAAGAGIPAPVADCLANAGRLTHHYSTSELQSALQTMGAAVGQYSNCGSVIQQALYAQIHHLGGGSGSGGGSFLPTWLLIVLIVLVLGGAGLAGVAIRRNRARGGPGEPPAPGGPGASPAPGAG